MSKAQTPASERLEHEPIAKLLWRSCSQTTLSVSAYGIYALTNAWFVAQGVGSDALAAVNLVAPLLLFLGAISTTLGVGAASVVSRNLGNGRPESAAQATGNAIIFFLISALAVTVGGIIFHEPLLRLLGVDDTTMPFARPYALILLGGSVFSTGFSAIVRAEGSFSFSMLLWIVPVICQVTLDPLFIFGFNLGVSGAALGTVGGQIVSAGMAFWFFFLNKNRPYTLKAPNLRLNRGRNRTDRVTHAMKLALAATITYGLLVAGVVAIGASAIVSVFVQDHELRALSSQSLTIVSIGFVFSGIPQLVAAYFQAIGRPAASYLLSVGTVLGLKIPIVLALAAHGPVGIWVALPLGEAAAAAAALALLHHAHKRKV